MEEKEFYRQQIIDNLNKIDEIDILQYIFIIVDDIIMEKENN